MTFNYTDAPDYFDSRDLLERIEELTETISDPEFYTDGDTKEDEELQALIKFANSARPYIEDFHHGETFIKDEAFTEYTKESAKEYIEHPEKLDVWPFTAIDWDEAADQLKVDFHSFELNGTTYWAR